MRKRACPCIFVCSFKQNLALRLKTLIKQQRCVRYMQYFNFDHAHFQPLMIPNRPSLERCNDVLHRLTSRVYSFHRCVIKGHGKYSLNIDLQRTCNNSPPHHARFFKVNMSGFPDRFQIVIQVVAGCFSQCTLLVVEKFHSIGEAVLRTHIA